MRNRKHPFVLFSLLLSLGLTQNLQETAYVQYFSDEVAFLSEIPMMATERNNLPHLVVSFNEEKQPIFIVKVSATQDTLSREVLSYNAKNSLKQKAIYGRSGSLAKIIQYGNDEPWSSAFRNLKNLANLKIYYTDQQTLFSLNQSGRIQDIIFRLIDGTSYGQISFKYNSNGVLKEELWMELPGKYILRKFIYEIIESNRIRQVWEYNQMDSLVSHVALQMAPEDQLYNTNFPKTGNVLDEAEIILKELVSQRILTSVPIFIPKTEWDILILKTGEVQEVEFIRENEHGLALRLKNDPTVLTIPAETVKTLTSKWGEVIFSEN